MLETLSNTICQINQKLHFPASLTITLEILSCLQILQLILETMASSFSNPKSILTIFTKTLPFFTAAFDFDSFSPLKAIIHPAWYLITLYLFTHILLILLAVLIPSSKQAFKALTLKILAIAYTIHSRILFFPIHYFYLSLINLYKDQHNVNSAPFYYEPAWFAITILFLVENFLLVIIKEFLLYQITKSKDYSAVKTNLYHQIIAAHKICLPIILILARDLESTAKLSSILHLIISLVSVGILYRCLPFYKFKVLKTSVVMSTINLSASVVGILQAFVKDTQVLNSLQIAFFMLAALGVKISLGIFKELLGRISVMKIKSPMYSIHFLLLMKEACLENELSEYQDKSFLPEKQLIIGFFSRNGINLLDMKDPVLKKGCSKEIYTLLLKKFEERYNWSPKNELLLSFIIRIYLKKFGNIAKGTHYLKKIENIGYSIHVKGYVNDFHSRLEEIYNKEYLKDEDGMKLAKYFRHKEVANSVKSGLSKEIERHIDVWEHLQGNIIDIKKIVDIVEDIDFLFIESQKQFNRNFEEFKSNFPLPILLYATYLHSIRCLPFEGDQQLSRFQAIVFNKQNRNDFDTYSDTSAVVIISLDPRKAGLIIDATGSIHNVFGMKKKEVIGFNFACLFPNSIAKAYQQEVSQYAKAPTYKLDKRYKTYGKTGMGEIFELEAHFKLYSYGNREITIAIMFTQLSGPKSLFIANYSGYIIECSKNLQSDLQKEQLHLKAFRSIQDLASDFDAVNQAFNQIYDAEDNFSLKTNPYIETKTGRLTDPRIPTFAIETDALSGRPLLNTNTEVLASIVRDEESLVPVTSMRHFQKYTLDYISSNLKTSSQIYRNVLNSSEKKKELNSLKAKKICDKFIQGRRVNLLPANENNMKLKANVKIKPLVLNREVHKVIFLTAIEHEKSSLADLDEVSQDSDKLMSSFADAFPDGSEGLSLKQIPGLSLRPKTSRKSPGTLQLSPPTQRPSYFNFETFHSETFKSHSQPSAPDQKKDRLIREIKAQEDHLRSTTDTKFRESGALKALKKISSSTRMLPLLKYLMLVIYLILIFIITLAGFSMGLSRKSVNEVSYAVQIVDIVTERSFCAQQFWQYTTTLYAAGLGIATFPNATLKGIKGAMNSGMEYIVPSNSNLKTLLGRLDTKSLLQTAYKRDVTFYNYYGTFVQKSEMEMFTATDLLIAKYGPVITLSDLKALPKDPDIPFLLNNTGNDYMIKSRNLNDLTFNFLKETTSNKVKSLRAVLSVQVAALVLLTITFVLIPFVIVKAYKRLLKALLKIPDIRMNERLNTIQAVQTLLNEDIEDKSFILDAYKQFGDPEAKPHSKRSRTTNNNAHQRHQYTMTKMNKYLIKLELSALVFIPIFVALFVVGLNRSINTFQSFSVVNDEMAVLKDCWDRSNMVLGSFAFTGVFITNPTMLIKNNVPLLQLRSDLEAFQSVNEKLTSTFIKGDDDTDPLIESMFKDSVCNNLRKDLQEQYNLFCLPATNGGTLGMLAVNEAYISASNKYVGTFLNNPSLLTLLGVALPYLNAVSGLLSTLNVSYPRLLRHIRDGFQVEVEKSLQRELDYFFAVLSVAIVYLLFIYFVPVRRLKRADASRRKILKVIPLKMIQENKIFSWYLINEFQSEIPSIKRYF